MKAKTHKKLKSNYHLSFLRKENDLNKIIRANRREPKKFRLLFISLWDDYCTALVERLKEEEVNSSQKLPLYVVDSYNMPHSFVIYNTTKVPQLVTVDKHKVSVEGYLPRIYTSLGIQ